MSCLRALYHGNPAAFYFLCAMACFFVLAAYLTPLTDARYYREMNQWEWEQYIERLERERSKEIQELERMMR